MANSDTNDSTAEVVSVATARPNSIVDLVRAQTAVASATGVYEAGIIASAARANIWLIADAAIATIRNTDAPIPSGNEYVHQQILASRERVTSLLRRRAGLAADVRQGNAR